MDYRYDEPFMFVESESGVHLLNPRYMDDGTLCGIGPDNPDLHGGWDTKEKVVTCPQCIRIIKHLMRVKINEEGRYKI